MGQPNLGAPVAYLVLRSGVPVYDPSGEQIGHVAAVLADERPDIFHGLLIGQPGIPERFRFADPDQIAGIHERGVTLAVVVDQLHEPTEDAVAARALPTDPVREGLRRAFEWLQKPRT